MAKMSALDRANERIKTLQTKLVAGLRDIKAAQEHTQTLSDYWEAAADLARARGEELKALRGAYDGLQQYARGVAARRDELLAQCNAHHAALRGLATIYFPPPQLPQVTQVTQVTQEPRASQQTGQIVSRLVHNTDTDGAEHV